MFSFTPTLSRTFIISFFSVLCINCSQQKVQKTISPEKKIEAVDFGGSYVLTDKAGNTAGSFGGRETIYLYDDMMMHQVPVFRSTSTYKQNNDELVHVSDSVLPTTYNYIVFKAQNDSIAFSYDSVQGPIIDTISVEKFLTNNFRSFGKNFRDNRDQLPMPVENNSNSITEKYTFREKPDNSYPDTVCYSYRKDYNDLRYSISPSLDSLKKMKLAKLRLVFNPDPKGTDTAFRLRRQLYVEMERKQVEDPAFIMALFNRFAKDRAAYVPSKSNP